MAAARFSQLTPAAGCRISPLGHPSSYCSRALPRVWLPLGLGGCSHVLQHQQQHQLQTSLCGRPAFTQWGGRKQPHQQAVLCCSLFKDAPSESMINDEEWQKQRREESKEFARLRELEENEGMEHADSYRKIQQSLQDFPQEEIKKAKKFVAGLIRAGSRVEELIEEAADNGELTPLVLLVVKNRLELAQQDDERDAAQALDLLYRRIQTEVLQRESSLAMVLLNELLNLHDGISHEQWLQQCRRTMLDIFPPEDAFTILGRPGFDLSKHHGPIDAPEEEDDTVLLRVDFIREVDEFLSTLEEQYDQKVAEGLDADAVAVRLRQQDKLRAIQLVKDLRRIAIKLKW